MCCYSLCFCGPSTSISFTFVILPYVPPWAWCWRDPKGHKSPSLVSLTCNIVGGSNHKPKTRQDNHRARHTHYDATPHPLVLHSGSARSWEAIEFLGGCIRPSLWHLGASLVAAPTLSCPVAYGILVPWPGIEFMSLPLEGIFLSTHHQASPKAFVMFWNKSRTWRHWSWFQS